MKIMLFAPELFLLLGCLMLFLFTMCEEQGGKARGAAVATGIGTVLLCASTFGKSGHLFMGAYAVDTYSQLFKFLIAASTTVVLMFCGPMKGVEDELRPEYYLFLMLSALGLMMLISSAELISLFVALELSSFSLYLLVPMRARRTGDRRQMEAAVKYILFGVMATGVMLFGMSYLFGLTGTTFLAGIVAGLSGETLAQPAAIAGIALVLGGFLFKLAVFPFHFWVPDVYEGAANETTAFIASVPKLGAVAMLVKFVMVLAPEGEIVARMLAALAVCSMFYGNLCALVQKDVKRMLGFSGIAHAGFVVLGLLTFEKLGYATSMYYIIGYVLMNLACFLVITQVSTRGENVAVSDLNGLYKRSPILAFTLAVGMFALAGIPPFVGFMGKFMLLAGALKAGHLTLVVLAAINTAIAIYYYLSVVKAAYCTPPDGGDSAAVDVDFTTRALSVVLIVAIIVMGVLPDSVLEITGAAVQAIL